MTRVDVLMPSILSHAQHVVGAIIILIIGLWLSSRADADVVRVLRRAPHVDEMLGNFFGNLVRYLILAITLLAV